MAMSSRSASRPTHRAAGSSDAASRVAVSMFITTKLNPQPTDPVQAKMMLFMPLAFSVMFFFFPAGLVLYWITNNVLSIAQQWLINTRMGVPPEFNLPKFGKT